MSASDLRAGRCAPGPTGRKENGPAIAALGNDNNKTRKMMALRTIVFPNGLTANQRAPFSTTSTSASVIIPTISQSAR